MTPPPRRDASAQSGDTGGDGSGPGGQASAPGSQARSPNGQASSPDGPASGPGGPASGADGQASGADGQAGGTDGQASGPGGQASGPGSQASGPGGQVGGRAAPATASAARSRRKRRLSWWAELLVLFVLALVIMLGIKTYVVQAFYIPSSSMENTLNIGDKVLVNKLVYHFRSVERGDVIVFNGEGSWDPPSPPASSDPIVRLASQFGHAVTGLFGISPGVHDYIKRVIGVPGDHVACCNAQGRITVNGVPLSEKSYLYPGNVPSMTKFSITVPPGRLWVMGDHRNVSYDSRGHVGDPGGGTVPESQVVGRAFVILWPPSRFRVLPIPVTFTKLNAGQALGARALSELTRPAAPLVLAGSVAVPLTWLDRRLRRRASGPPAAACAAGRRWPARREKRR